MTLQMDKKFSKLSSMGVMNGFVKSIADLEKEREEEREKEPDYQIDINKGMTFGVQQLARIKIQMDTSKAMAILGFSSSQTFEATKLEEIEKAFLRKMDVCLKQRKKKRRGSRFEEDNLNKQIRNLNEAMQFLSRKRTKSKAVMESWHQKGNKGALVGMAIRGMTVDERTRMMRDPSYVEKMQRLQAEQDAASQDAISMAEALIAGIEKSHEEQGIEKTIKRRYVFNVCTPWDFTENMDNYEAGT